MPECHLPQTSLPPQMSAVSVRGLYGSSFSGGIRGNSRRRLAHKCFPISFGLLPAPACHPRKESQADASYCCFSLQYMYAVQVLGGKNGLLMESSLIRRQDLYQKIGFLYLLIIAGMDMILMHYMMMGKHLISIKR